MENLITLSRLKPKQFIELINKAQDIKTNQTKYAQKLYEKTLLMIFQAPSLRTKISFEVAMNQLHGNAIDYELSHSPFGIGKETIEDFGKTISQYCDVITARIYSHTEFKKLAKAASVPVINAMTNNGHPCQILSDFQTINEHVGKIKNIKIAYLGDSKNNVTYSLMRACAITNNKLSIACPKKDEYYPKDSIIKETKKLSQKYKGNITITSNSKQAVKNADIIYTDSWMSYRIPKEEKEKRAKDLKPYQVNKSLFRKAKKSALFMHCLPATRGHEVTKDIIDSKRSIVFPQAENRLHMQKAIILELLRK
jgi:ornithine carbamoyltransferase